MLTIFLLISAVMFCGAAVVESVGYHKKIRLMELIAKPLMYTFLLSSAVLLLVPHIPDSTAIIVVIAISTVTGGVGSCLLLYPKNKRKIVFISSALFVISFLAYLYLIWPSFRLFSLPVAVTILILAFYGAMLVLYYIFVLKKRSFLKTVGIVLFFVPLLILHYGSVLTLCGQPRLYSALLTVGSTIFIASQALIVKGFFTESDRAERLLRMILYIAGQFFVTAGFAAMVAV